MRPKRTLSPELYIQSFEHVFRIPKYGGTTLVPLTVNEPQRELIETFDENNLILKSRKLGFTTIVEAFFILNCLEFEGTKIVFLADNDANTDSIFEKTRDLITNCNPEFHGFEGVVCEKRKIMFPNRSSINISTAGRKSAFRGKDVHGVHLSEIAFYEYPDVYEAVLDARSKGNAVVFLESTANGRNLFFDLWEKAKTYPRGSEFKPFFYGWDKHPENTTDVQIGFKLDKEEIELQTQYNLTINQMAWRRWKINSMPNPDKFPQEHPITETEAFLSSGRPVFDVIVLNKMRDSVMLDYRPVENIYNKAGEVIVNEVKLGPIKLFHAPKASKLYLIGCDCAEGVDGGDYNTAQVLDVETSTQVAEYKRLCDPDTFAYDLNKLGRYYNNGMMAPERNGQGFTVIRCLVNDYSYPNMYQEEQNTDEMVINQTENYGFRTNIKSRQIIIDLAKRIIRQNSVKINSIELLNELMSFVYTRSGKAQHDTNKHDDLVFAFMIACYLLEQFGDILANKPNLDKSLYASKFKKRREEVRPNYGRGGYG